MTLQHVSDNCVTIMTVYNKVRSIPVFPTISAISKALDFPD